MSGAHNTLLFTNTLALMNTARKYYADLLARRSCGKTPPSGITHHPLFHYLLLKLPGILPTGWIKPGLVFWDWSAGKTTGVPNR
jgi:hypothetical protein